MANNIAYQLARTIGYAPMCVWHTMEYLPYFMGHGVNLEDTYTIQQWRGDLRRKWVSEAWEEMEGLATGRLSIDAFLEKEQADHASDIIEAMWSGRNGVYYMLSLIHI